MVTQSSDYYCEAAEVAPREWYQHETGRPHTGAFARPAGLLLGGLAVGALIAAAVHFSPDFVRYMKMRQM